MSIVRIGLGETKGSAEGYEAIFGKKKEENEQEKDDKQEQDKKKEETNQSSK